MAKFIVVTDSESSIEIMVNIESIVMITSDDESSIINIDGSIARISDTFDDLRNKLDVVGIQWR